MAWHRKKFVTHLDVQLRLALIFIFWTLVLLACLGSLFFINYSQISTDTGEMTIHDQLLTKTLLVSQARNLLLYYGASILLYIIFIGIYIVVYSHRIVGPVHKLNLILQKATRDKEWPKNLRFRKSDSFHELAKNFNEFVEAMKSSK